MQITYSPLERLALSIEDLLTSNGGTLTSDTNEILTSWPKLEPCLIQADIPTDPLAVLAAAARDSDVGPAPDTASGAIRDQLGVSGISIENQRTKRFSDDQSRAVRLL